jgi:hypothetical protein
MINDNIRKALILAIQELHRIQLPDYVVRNDGGLSMYSELNKRMRWAKDAERKILDMTGMDYYNLTIDPQDLVRNHK